MDNITILGRTNFRNNNQAFGIKQPDRLSHTYIIGKTGVGKTTLMENMIMQDLLSNRGCAVLDPHGDLVERLYALAKNNTDIDDKHVIYLNVPDPLQPFGYNPIRRVSPDLRPLLASGILEVFKKLWKEAWGVRMEHIFRNVLLTLLDQPESSLADIPRILNEKNFRHRAQRHVTSPYVKDFWSKEFAKYSYRYRADAIAPILNKMGGFLANPVLSRILTEPEQNLSLRTLMDAGNVILINLSKGKLGEDASHLLGGLLTTSIGLAAFSRANIPEETRRPFFLYADEFQNFTTLSLVNMASELRKFGLGMILAHQYLDQLDGEIRSALLGNCATLITFRIGPEDAAFISKEYFPRFDQYDLMNLPNYEFYIKLMIDGRPSWGFSGVTIKLWL